jgi:T-complex protein 1 subunit eta
MDKLIYGEGNSVTISNDGATVMKMLDIVHPAAKTLVEIAKSQDSEVGDGTTSVVVFAGELLKESKSFVEDGMHPQLIIKGFRKACALAKAKIRELGVSIDAKTAEERRVLLERCAATSLSSKLVAGQSAFFSKMIVDAVEKLDTDLDLSMIGMKKETGGSLQDSIFVEGVAFKKTFSYAGFEQAPKRFENPKIVLLNVELELKNERENAEIRINNPADYQKFVDAEWNIIYGKLDALVATGAKVVLSRLAIGDLATQYFADRGIFCAGRVPDEDMRRVAKATGGQLQTSTNTITESMLGTCGLFEERQVGSHRYNFFTGCAGSKSATILLRGGGDQFIDEAERSLHDAIMIVRRASKHKAIVGGGGAIEMELSRYLHDFARTIPGKQQMIISLFAKALEVIPRQLSDNAGLDSTDVLNQLRQAHAEGKIWAGVNLASDATHLIHDSVEAYVWEPSLVKLNSLEAATEAACMILSVDETVKNAKVDNSLPNAPHRRQGGMGGGMGMPM